MSKFENYFVSILDRNRDINDKFLKIKLSIHKTEFIKELTFLTDDYKNKINFILIDKNKYYIDDKNTIKIKDNLYGINEVLIYFKDSYLKKCEKEEYILGLYYPKCNCCVEDFRILKNEFNYESPFFDIKSKELVYKILIPEIRFNIFYEIQKNIYEYNPNKI